MAYYIYINVNIICHLLYSLFLQTNPIRPYILSTCLNDIGDNSQMLTSMLRLSISCSLKYSPDNIRYKSNLFEFHKIGLLKYIYILFVKSLNVIHYILSKYVM